MARGTLTNACVYCVRQKYVQNIYYLYYVCVGVCVYVCVCVCYTHACVCSVMIYCHNNLVCFVDMMC